MFMDYSVGMRVKDTHADREGLHGTVTTVEWEDEFSPTVHVQWDNNTAGSDEHGVQDIAPVEYEQCECCNRMIEI